MAKGWSHLLERILPDDEALTLHEAQTLSCRSTRDMSLNGLSLLPQRHRRGGPKPRLWESAANCPLHQPGVYSSGDKTWCQPTFPLSTLVYAHGCERRIPRRRLSKSCIYRRLHTHSQVPLFSRDETWKHKSSLYSAHRTFARDVADSEARA